MSHVTHEADLALLSVGLSALTGGAPKSTTDSAENYPSKTVTWICPGSPGGGTDRLTRFMADKLQKELGVTSVVVTHDMPTAWYVADRVALLWDQGFPYVDEPTAFQALPDEPVQSFITGAY